MKKFDLFRKELLSDPEVLREYEEHKMEFEIAQALIKARLKAHLTQTQVAERMHTSQSQVARMESGAHMPSFHSIHKYAQAVNQHIHLEIKP